MEDYEAAAAEAAPVAPELPAPPMPHDDDNDAYYLSAEYIQWREERRRYWRAYLRKRRLAAQRRAVRDYRRLYDGELYIKVHRRVRDLVTVEFEAPAPDELSPRQTLSLVNRLRRIATFARA